MVYREDPLHPIVTQSVMALFPSTVTSTSVAELYEDRRLDRKPASARTRTATFVASRRRAIADTTTIHGVPMRR